MADSRTAYSCVKCHRRFDGTGQKLPSDGWPQKNDRTARCPKLDDICKSYRDEPGHAELIGLTPGELMNRRGAEQWLAYNENKWSEDYW